MSEPEFSWSRITRWRGECKARYHDVKRLPFVRHTGPWFKMLLTKNSRVLDIGASVHKTRKQAITQPQQEYFSLDIDPAGDFDFHSFDDIPDDQLFDVMIAHQVLEHVKISEAYSIVQSAYDHLVTGGYLMVTVPNPMHPIRQWSDVTHITAWPYFDLYGLFREAGFTITKFARYNKYGRPKSPFTYIAAIEFRMDWADGLVIIGQKP
jgi:hypothetical protein